MRGLDSDLEELAGLGDVGSGRIEDHQLDGPRHRGRAGDDSGPGEDGDAHGRTGSPDWMVANSSRAMTLQAERRRPLFLYVGFSVPHYPIQEEARWTKPYESAMKTGSWMTSSRVVS